MYRSKTDRVIFGVCGGLGEYFDIDPIIFRIAFIALTIGAGSGILLYLILAFLTPPSPALTEEKRQPQEINIKDKVENLASELKNKDFGIKRGYGAVRVLSGLILLLIGFILLAQNLNLIPGFVFDFSVLLNLWPIIIVLLGISLLSGTQRK